jgi:[ribosomal protein S18]-alanine N-acetyltransferase
VSILHQHITIRLATPDDLADIVNNEKQCYQVPWSEQNLKACLTSDYHFWVMQYQAQLLGHMIVQTVLDETHLHNVCVTPQHQSQGLGKLWLDYLVSFAKTTACKVIFLEVRKSNNTAIQLYQKLGFTSIGERKNYYTTNNGHENGLVMELTTANFDSIKEERLG